MSSSPSPAPAATRLDLDGNPVAPLTICMIGAGGFIGSHLCEKLMAETSHVVLAVDVYCDKIRHLVDPAPPHLAGRISFHRLNIKNDSRLEGLIKMADLVGICHAISPNPLLIVQYSINSLSCSDLLPRP
jgi:UDP-apiose/xylose synthase